LSILAAPSNPDPHMRSPETHELSEEKMQTDLLHPHRISTG
jgi:hypothetical protein